MNDLRGFALTVLRSCLVGLLDGRRAIVTGGGSGIGRRTCRRFAEEGARVAVLDLDGGAADAVASEIDGVSFGVDVRDADAVGAAVDEAARRLGGVDIAFNNAGIFEMAALEETTDDMWNRHLTTNVTGAFLCARRAVPDTIISADRARQARRFGICQYKGIGGLSSGI